MNIIAIVVTYNRLELLKKNIKCLRENKPINSIVIINNGSTDGTKDWLETQHDITVINQQNTGGSGGFNRGIEYAYKEGADWIWCMDDDVFPREDCLEQLLKNINNDNIGILAPRRLQDGKIFTHDFQEYNLINPFSSMYHKRISKIEVNSPIYIKGTAFEGPFIRRSVIEKIGLPNKDLFIFCDDTDYCLRTVLAGFDILYVPSALMDKKKFFTNDSWAEKSRKKKWKRYYQIRNSTYLNHHYGKNWGVRYIRGFIGVAGYLLIAAVSCPFTKAYQYKDIPKLWKAYIDGINENLGIINM